MEGLIVAIASALVGAIVGGVIGAYSAHRVHKKETLNSQKVLATAIYQEMESLLRVIEGLVEVAGNEKEAWALVKVISTFRHYTRVYDNNLDKIGLLGANRVGEIIRFYNSFEIQLTKMEYMKSTAGLVDGAQLEAFTEKLAHMCKIGRKVQRRLLSMSVIQRDMEDDGTLGNCPDGR